MTALIKITKYSHFFKVTKISPRARTAVIAFARRYVQYGFRRPGSGGSAPMLKVFAAAREDKTEYRFHINTLPEFMTLLDQQYLRGELVDITQMPLHDALPLNVKVLDKWQPREHQVGPIEYMVRPGEPNARLLGLPPGQGKSFSAMKAMAVIDEAALIILKPKYIEKWISDLRKTYEDLTVDDIMVVKGSQQLMALLEIAATEGISWKFVIISNKTIQNWIKLYEKIGVDILDVGYNCLPEQLCERLKVGVILSDEVHEDFHLGYKIALYTNVKKMISLSATLLADDAFLDRMYATQYPKDQRYNGGAMERYIDAAAIVYRFDYPDKVWGVNPKTGMYSHNLFEQNIMRQKNLAQSYMLLITDMIDRYWIDIKKPGQKCIVFVATIDFATMLSEHLKTKYGGENDVRRKVEDDPYNNLLESDLVVSTLQSAGTGVDIPDLVTAIMTVALRSSQGNIQGAGRLRKLDDGSIPYFLYFLCNDQEKHVEYGFKKKELLEERTVRNAIYTYPRLI